ncbi:hypothetical protein M408DRAFT_22846 [Serendipita vermifera MAFF 305830]|uniref:HMG box domain-containing protein n=1 Tax=Serendipita vermifera MAFF 305830 TaxID=933852 RepID=A0A0C3BDG5_SERVB|nr:hypothetical protein M408DRAFT_22846 [Serendipita vermifera MAFF 305830]
MASDPSSCRPGSADKHEDRPQTVAERASSPSTQVRHMDAMDVDDPEGTLVNSESNPGVQSSTSRPASWHSDDIHSQRVGPAVPKAFSLSDARSTSPATSLSERRAENNAVHDAAYRLFKTSIKQASEKYGPFLPPDDGSPYLALRLHRLWQDLSKEQRLEYYARVTASETNPEGLDVSQKPSRPYSPQFRSASTGYTSPPLTTASGPARPRYSPYEIPEPHNLSAQTPELRSPVFSTDDDPSCGSVRSRSHSPMGEDGQPTQSHVPRPPNAWILFRSTMSKSRRPDGIVYSPPEISVMWKNLNTAEREVWFDRAKEAKQQHEVANPGYKYQPNRTKSQGARKSSDTHGGTSAASSRGHRSHSARSPPPWHTRF